MKKSAKVALGLFSIAAVGGGLAWVMLRKKKEEPTEVSDEGDRVLTTQPPIQHRSPADILDELPGTDTGEDNVTVDLPSVVSDTTDILDELPGVTVGEGENVHVELPEDVGVPDEIEEEVEKDLPGVEIDEGEIVVDPRKPPPVIEDIIKKVPGVDLSNGKVTIDVPSDILRPKVPPIPPKPQPPQAPHPPVAEVTSEMVDALLNAERSPAWKRKSDEVAIWQKANGMTADGMLGPGSNLRLALEVGTLPIVRYWPKSVRNAPAAVEDYRDAVRDIADEVGGTHGELLRASAQREQGQGFGVFAKPNLPKASDGKEPVL